MKKRISAFDMSAAMRFTAAISLSLAMLLSLTACGETGNSASSQSSSSVAEQQTTKLTNHMTGTEKSRISVGAFSLMDTQEEPAALTSAVEKHTVQVDLWDGNDYLEQMQKNDMQSKLSEEEYQAHMETYQEMNKYGSKSIHAVVIDGRWYAGFMPAYGYDGGSISFFSMKTVMTEDGQSAPESKQQEFSSFDEFKPWYRENLNEAVSNGELTQAEADQEYADMLVIFDSVIHQTYEVFDNHVSAADYSTGEEDLRDTWEFKPDEVLEIKDAIKEISVYDEELDTTFIVHVTLPPDFDKAKTYPMFVMTDGVWRFGDHPALRKMMEKHEAADVILVSIGYDFSIDGTDNSVRGNYFCEQKDKFLSFITDNLMPYLNEDYNIDFSQSTLYGHSLGGVFTHYAACNSDAYENQPFHNYIIGSPAFWSPCFPNHGEYKTEYGYFDRNMTFNKSLYISGGENEDPDYAEYYGENDSTLTGISNLMKRLEAYGVTSAECKIYEGSNHYAYIPDMFKTFFLANYPASGSRTCP